MKHNGTGAYSGAERSHENQKVQHQSVPFLVTFYDEPPEAVKQPTLHLGCGKEASRWYTLPPGPRTLCISRTSVRIIDGRGGGLYRSMRPPS